MILRKRIDLWTRERVAARGMGGEGKRGDAGG